MKLKIRDGAASMSYDLIRGRNLVATVWSGEKQPTEEAAFRNAQILATAFDMQSALRAAVDRLEYLGDEPAMIAQIKAALPRIYPEPEA